MYRLHVGENGGNGVNWKMDENGKKRSQIIEPPCTKGAQYKFKSC